MLFVKSQKPGLSVSVYCEYLLSVKMSNCVFATNSTNKKKGLN